MKRTTFFAAVLCLLGAGLSCTHDEPNNSDTGTGQRVVEWQDSTLSGDAVMGEKMIFKVGGGMSVERSEGTRASTDVNGIAKFTVNDLVTIGLTRGATDETKNYKVTATSQTSADPDVWTSSLAYNGSASDAFFWKSTGESVTIRAWSYGDGSTTSSDPDNQTYTLSEDQSANYGELLYSKATSFDYENYSSGIPIQFCHQMTRLVINVTHIKPGDLDISEIYIGDGSETPIPTTAKFHKPTSGNVGTWDNLGSEKGQITPKTETANSCYSAVLIPTTYEVADKKFIIIKTSDGRTYCYIPNENLTLVAGTQYNYTISVKDLKEVSTLTIGDIADYTYDGTAKTPTPTVKDGTKTLVKDTDYELSYSNNINAGTATVTVTGKGGYYSGSQSKNFTINRKTLTSSDFYFESSAITRTYIWEIGSGTNKLNMPSDCTVEYTSGNTAVAIVSNASTGALLPGGTLNANATITATCTGNYIGTASYTIQATSKEKTYSFTGGIQSDAICPGVYTLEAWGAQGGSYFATGGKGGYATGRWTCTSATNIYVGVGGQPVNYAAGGYNGGGIGNNDGGNVSVYYSAGGGGTHIAYGATNRGVMSGYASYTAELLIIAGGGGGGSIYGKTTYQKVYLTGGNGGGTTPGTVMHAAFAATPTASYYLVSSAEAGQLNGKLGVGETNSGSGYSSGKQIAAGSNVWSGGGATGYVKSGLTNSSQTTGSRSGNGQAKITWVSN